MGHRYLRSALPDLGLHLDGHQGRLRRAWARSTWPALRFFIAGALMAVVALATRARWPRGRAEWQAMVLVGLLMFAGDYGLIYWAEQYIESGLTAVLFGRCR